MAAGLLIHAVDLADLLAMQHPADHGQHLGSNWCRWGTGPRCSRLTKEYRPEEPGFRKA